MKKLSLLMCVLLALGALCPAAMAESPVVLKYMTSASGVQWEAEQQIIADFEAANPGIKIEPTVVAGTSDFVTVLATKFSAGEQPDVFTFQGGSRTIEYAAAGKLYDLSGQPFLDRFYESDLELNAYRDGVYAAPVTNEMTGLLINTDALSQYGEFEYPESFPELIELCQQLREAGLEYPLLCAGKDIGNVSQVDFQYLATVVWYNNPDYYLEILNGERGFDDELIVKMFEKYEQLREYMSEDSLGVDNDEAVKRFIRGDGVLWIAHGNTVSTIRDMAGDEFNFVLIPSVLQDNPEDRVMNIGVCQSIQIVADTEHLDESLKFVDFFTSPESAETYVNVGRVYSSNKDVTLIPDPAMQPCADFMEAHPERRIGHADLVWIAGIKDVMKEVTQNWFLGDPLEDCVAKWQEQHLALLEANPDFVTEYTEKYYGE